MRADTQVWKDIPGFLSIEVIAKAEVCTDGSVLRDHLDELCLGDCRPACFRQAVDQKIVCPEDLRPIAQSHRGRILESRKGTCHDEPFNIPHRAQGLICQGLGVCIFLVIPSVSTEQSPHSSVSCILASAVVLTPTRT